MSRHDRGPLRAPRDTGIVLRSATRMDRRRERQDAWQTPLLVVVTLILVAGITISALSQPRPVVKATVAAPAPAPATPEEPDIIPTPAFAQIRTVQLHLPVAATAVTAMAFHQATYTHAQPMISLVGEMSVGEAARAAKAARAALKAARNATGTAAATAAPGPTAPATSTMTPEGIWTGRAVRVWRQGRPGKPDTAVDVGAAPGTVVVAPIDGTIALVKEYKLYGKYSDYEIHISTPAWPDLDVVVLHVTDPCVFAGQPVVGGVTPIASVRKLSSFTAMQLRTYTTDGGDHCHVQVNKVETGTYVPPDDLEHILE